MKTEWRKGIPTEPGVYWFDTSTGIGHKPLVLRIFDGSTPYFYGDGGSGPLDFIVPRMKHAIIQPHNGTWGEKISTRTWVRRPDGCIGFGLFYKIDNDSHEAYGSILWFGEQPSAAHGLWIRRVDEYLYCNVKKVKIP